MMANQVVRDKERLGIDLTLTRWPDLAVGIQVAC